MEKIINFKKTIKEIIHDDPEVLEIMKTIGFENITNPMMLNTAGRFMTIPKGAEMKKIDIESIKEEFIKKGYTIIE